MQTALIYGTMADPDSNPLSYIRSGFGLNPEPMFSMDSYTTSTKKKEKRKNRSLTGFRSNIRSMMECNKQQTLK